MAVLAGESGRRETVLGSTHDLDGAAEHLARMLALNGALVADGPAALIRHPDVLRSTYGGHGCQQYGPSCLSARCPFWSSGLLLLRTGS